METSSDPPHFSASLPLCKQQRPVSCWEKNIYLEKHASMHTRKQEHFISPSLPSLLFVRLRLYSLDLRGNGVVTVKPWLLANFRGSRLCEALPALLECNSLNIFVSFYVTTFKYIDKAPFVIISLVLSLKLWL